MNSLVISRENNEIWPDAPASGISQSGALPPAAGPEETEYTKKLKDGFGFFGLATLVYACFYAFCMFRNPSGVTYPFFMAGSLLFFGLSLAKLGISLKKGSGFYMAAMMLLSISTFCTDDGRIIFMNKVGILLLFLSFLLAQMYDTAGWRLGKYLESIFLLLFASIGNLPRPFRDAARFRSRKQSAAGGKGGKALLVILAAGLSAPLLVVVYLLLCSADVMFREIGKSLSMNLRVGNFFQACMMVACMFLMAYCLLSYLCERKIPAKGPEVRKGEPVLAITVTGMLTALYLVFSVVQVLGLFLRKMSLPAGYTYAQYAREGFFQLLAVSLLNLAIVLAVLAYFRESRVLKGVLSLMSLCTFIMIASSALRMVMYIRYYYLTFLRILVLWALAVLAALFVGVVISIFQKRFPLFGYSCVVVTCCYLLLSFSHPDYWIAKVNLANLSFPAREAIEATPEGDLDGEDVGGASGAGDLASSFFLGEGYRDFGYLNGLSADAAPLLVPFLEKHMEDGSLSDLGVPLRLVGNEWKPIYLVWLQGVREKEDNPLHFNVSRAIAFKELEKL